MNKLNLILLRHGETDHNKGARLTGWGDLDLNETGREQAKIAAARLVAEYKIEQIYVSSLQRAQQTAAILARLTGLTPIIKEDLKELNFGEMEGMSIPEIKRQMPELFSAWRSTDPLFGWPGGETREFFHNRVDRAIWDIIEAEANLHETVAIVGHGAALAGFVTEVVTGSPYLWREWLLENSEHYVVSVSYPSGLTPTRQSVKLELVYMGKQLALAEENRLREDEPQSGQAQ